MASSTSAPAPRSSPPTRSPSWPSCTAASTPVGWSCSPPAGTARGDRRRRQARLPARDAGDTGGPLLAGRRAARRLRRPPGRDHRADRPQARHQRAQLGCQGLHGRLRGRQLADLGEPGLRPGQPDRRDRGDDHLRASDGRHYELGEETATLLVARAASTCPRRHIAFDGTPAPARWSTSASSPSTARPGSPPRGSAPTSTCRRWSTTWRRASGTRS